MKKVLFDDLDFKPHPYIAWLEQARVKGCSILSGWMDGLYEVMDRDGEVYKGLTTKEVEDIINS